MDSMDCLPYGVVVSCNATGLIHFVKVITEGCRIDSSFAVGVNHTHRPNTPAMRRSRSVEANVGIIVSDKSVIAHICAVIKETLSWPSLHINGITDFLIPRDIVPAISPALLPIGAVSHMTFPECCFQYRQHLLGSEHSPMPVTGTLSITDGSSRSASAFPTETAKAKAQRERRNASRVAPVQAHAAPSPPPPLPPSADRMAAAQQTLTDLIHHNSNNALDFAYRLTEQLSYDDRMKAAQQTIIDIGNTDHQGALNLFYGTIERLNVSHPEDTRHALSGILHQSDSAEEGEEEEKNGGSGMELAN